MIAIQTIARMSVVAMYVVVHPLIVVSHFRALSTFETDPCTALNNSFLIFWAVCVCECVCVCACVCVCVSVCMCVCVCVCV